jgi:hypothetical protein
MLSSGWEEFIDEIATLFHASQEVFTGIVAALDP